jgi:hypothetical protein
MGILAKRFPEYGVILQIFRGPITRQAWIDYYDGFAADDTDRFITYLDPTADLSQLDVASGPELKRVVAGKLRAVYGEKPVVSILAPGSEAQVMYANFWRAFESAGEEKHPAESVVVADLKAACELLGLPDGAFEALTAAVNS